MASCRRARMAPVRRTRRVTPSADIIALPLALTAGTRFGTHAVTAQIHEGPSTAREVAR